MKIFHYDKLYDVFQTVYMTYPYLNRAEMIFNRLWPSNLYADRDPSSPYHIRLSVSNIFSALQVGSLLHNTLYQY